MKTIIFTKRNNIYGRNFFSKILSVLTFLFFISFSQAQTYVFDYTGAEQTFIVPSGVTSVDLQVWGAEGGKGFLDSPGGRGGYASGTLAVTPGQILYIYVGGKGASHASGAITGGGFNGGGDSRGVNHLVGAGGGASDVRIGGNTFNERVIVAGGGGGACGTSYTGGNGGGTEGGQGTNNPNDNPGGGGGTQVSGGSSTSCENGIFGIGGSSTITAQCAGGGGGWYGGGAGCGAGGGSGFTGGVSAGTMTSGIRTGNGQVQIHTNSNTDNDLCINAIPVNCGEIIIGSTAGTGIDTPPACGVGTGTSGGLWYSFVGTGEDVTFSTCNPGTDFNTQLSVYIGTCDELICVDSNDDAPGCNEQSELSITTIDGAFYYILVNGAGTAEGDFELSVICGTPCENATPLTCSFTESGSNVNAPVATSPVCGNVPNGQGVWYSFTGNDQCVFLSTCDANGGLSTTFDTQLSIYTGSCGNLTCVAYNDDAADGNGGTCDTDYPSSIVFFAEAGTDYLVLVHGVNGATGNFFLDYVCYDRNPLQVTCPPDVLLGCGETIPPPATNRLDFIIQGGSINGGSCAFDNDNYIITFEDLNEGDNCDGIVVERVYYVENIITGMEASCEQRFTFPPSPDFSIECNPGVEVECAEDIVVSQNDLIVNSNCNFGYTVDTDGPFIENGAPNCPGTTYTYVYTVIPNGCGEPQSCKRDFTITSISNIEITCPADITVSCENEINLDPNDAIVTTSCNRGYTVYIRNGKTWGVPGCNGTMYNYEYVVVDDCGTTAECTQMVTISNSPASIDVPSGGLVECFEDIEISLNDASVTNSCAEYNLYLTSPEVNGELGCPGSTYTYTYRMIDVCGNVVEEEVVFTNTNNETPSIEAPIDITCECLAGINPNPDHATVSTGCTVGSTVTVTGPQIIGTLDCPGTQYIYTYTVSDNCGRTDSDIQIFTVQNEGPVFVDCEEDTWLQFNCEDYGGEEGTIAVIEAYIASVEAYSSCGNQLAVFNDFNPNDINTCINNGISTITFSATDNCGRTSSCQTIYVVVDTEAPVIFEEAADHWEICNYNSPENFQDWVANHGNAEAVDECSNDNFTWSTIPANPTFNCMGASGVTSVSVTFVATDNCGNAASTTATFNAFMNGNDISGGNEDRPDNMEKVMLEQNRPNPFADHTVISFNLPETTNASLRFFDINGKVLKEIKGDFNTGYNEVSLNKNDFNYIGVLYYQLMTNQESVTRSMIIVE